MSWVRDYYGCDCGCYDCPTCHPEYSGEISCKCCGAELKVWQVDDNGLCEECMDRKQCEVCDRWTEQYNEDWYENGVICPDCEQKENAKGEQKDGQ